MLEEEREEAATSSFPSLLFCLFSSHFLSFCFLLCTQYISFLLVCSLLSFPFMSPFPVFFLLFLSDFLSAHSVSCHPFLLFLSSVASSPLLSFSLHFSCSFFSFNLISSSPLTDLLPSTPIFCFLSFPFFSFHFLLCHLYFPPQLCFLSCLPLVSFIQSWFL